MAWRCGLVLLAVALAAGRAGAEGDAERGEAVLRAAGGCSCHTDFEASAPELAGGRAIETPFGAFVASNLTPDPETGLGRWTEADFVRAMREGHAPDGSAYFPVFPYTSFTGMSDADLADLWAWLRALEPVEREEPPHPAWAPFRWRLAARAWQWLHFTPERFEPDPARDAAWNRGAYLVEAVAHCGECHTPRTWTGGLDRSRWLAGSEEGPEGELAPNLTPDDETGLGPWSRVDLVWYLETGLKPDGDDTQGLMAEVIEHGYSHLPREDRVAIAIYLESLEPRTGPSVR